MGFHRASVARHHFYLFIVYDALIAGAGLGPMRLTLTSAPCALLAGRHHRHAGGSRRRSRLPLRQASGHARRHNAHDRKAGRRLHDRVRRHDTVCGQVDRGAIRVVSALNDGGDITDGAAHLIANCIDREILMWSGK